MTDAPAPGPEPTPLPAKSAPWWWPDMRSVLSILSTLLLAGAFAALFATAVLGWKVDPAISQALGQFTGAIILQWGGVMGFYFATSKGSAAKDATILQLTPKDPQP